MHMEKVGELWVEVTHRNYHALSTRLRVDRNDLGDPIDIYFRTGR